jgi:hypothetical protein
MRCPISPRRPPFSSSVWRTGSGCVAVWIGDRRDARRRAGRSLVGVVRRRSLAGRAGLRDRHVTGDRDWRGSTDDDPGRRSVPEAYQDPIRRLAEACRLIANELAEHRLPAAARDQLREIAETSAHLPLTQSMSAVVILAQTRSMVADMMQLTGLEYADARELIPDMD